MAPQTAYFKEHEGIVHNSIGQLSSVPWWSNALRSQSVYGESLNPFPIENPNSDNGEELGATKQTGWISEEGLGKGNITPFTIYPGDSKTSGDTQKALPFSLPEYGARLDLGFGQPLICANPYMDKCYGIFSPYGPQNTGRIMLPAWSLTTDDGPILVNAKQYHGIIRRRQSRAKAVMENRSTRARKPYMHESRHLHAMRRPRGCGGRFLNTKNLNNGKSSTEVKKTDDTKRSQSNSQNSIVLQSDSGTLNSSKELNGSGSTLSGSEVTSMYFRGDLDHFQINRLGSSFRTFSNIMDSGHGIVVPSKWNI